jgi:hypothetical protein
VLVHAIGALGPVDALVGLLVPELDDLDALHLAAHRVEVVDGVEVAIDRAADRMRAKVGVGVRGGIRLLRSDGCGGSGDEAEGEQRERTAEHRERAEHGGGLGSGDHEC